MEQIHQNPLKGYFRQFKLYLKLPSGTSYYPTSSIEFTDMGEIGIRPMTGKDELILKNPDALLNGEALIEVIRSCAPAVSNPRILLTNDIDAIITAVRYATYNDSLETEIACPACGHENLYKLNLQYSLDNMSQLESEYVVNLDNDLSVFVKPYGFPELLKGLHAQFEQSKIKRAIESENISEEDRIKLFATAFKDLSVITYKLLTNSIVKIVNEQNNINVTDKKDIEEFLQNIDKKSSDKISDLVKEINQIGIKKTFNATCEKCKHTWENEIDFNPVNFS
jgi:DNA-directed RNA polymerase subunit M/transcription elongation factor TFIIS